jgi:hypothetical protein
MCNAAYSGDAATVNQLLQSGKGNAKEVQTFHFPYCIVI